MKKLLIQVLILFCICKVASSQITFQKTYGGTGGEASCYSLQQTNDGGYILVGSTANYSAMYLIKTAPDGDTSWTKAFEGVSGYCVKQTTDSGYIIVGETSSFGAGNEDVYLIKLLENGDTEFTKTYGGILNDYGNSIQQTTDGGYIIAGMTCTFGAGICDVFLIKTNALGDTLWIKTFGGASGSDSYCQSVQQTADGGYILAGNTDSLGTGKCDVFIIKTQANGDILWTKTFGGTNDDYGNSLQQTNDGGYIIAGSTKSYGAGNSDVYLIKIDSNGDTLWTKTYGGTNADYGESVQQTFDGGYVIAGSTLNFSTNPYNVYLLKTDSNGEILWTKTFGGINSEYGKGVQQTSDGGYVIAGYTIDYTPVTNAVYLVKTDDNGNSGCDQANAATIVNSAATRVKTPVTVVTSPIIIVTTPATIVGSGGGTITTMCSSAINNSEIAENPYSIYPNPAISAITVETPQRTTIEIYNIQGQLLKTLIAFNNSTSIDIAAFPAGVYVVFLKTDGGVGVRKFVKE